MARRRRDPSSEPDYDSEDQPSPTQTRRSSTASAAPRRSSRRGSRASGRDEENDEEPKKWHISIDQKDDREMDENGKHHYVTQLHYNFQSLVGNARFSFVEDITAEVKALADARQLLRVSKGVKREVQSEREGKLEQLHERLSENASEEEAVRAIEVVMDIEIARGYEGAPFLPTLKKVPGWTMSFGSDGYIHLDPGKFLPSRLSPVTDISKLLEGVKESAAASWRAYFEETTSDHDLKVGQLALKLLTELDEHYRQTRLSAPGGLKRMTDMTNKLKGFCFGTEISHYGLRSAGIDEENNNERFRLHVLVSTSTKNNPQGVSEVSSHFKLEEFCDELGEDPAKFPEAGSCFLRDVENLIEIANTTEGGMDVDEFKRRMNLLRPAGHGRTRPSAGGSSFEHPHRPAAVWYLRRALGYATKSSSERDQLLQTHPSFAKILEKIVTRVIKVDDEDVTQLIIKDEFTGEILVRTSQKLVQWWEWLESQKGIPSPISIDHLNQIIIEMQEDGKVAPGFHSINNLVVTSPLVNNAKHRYPSVLLDLFLANIAVGSEEAYLTKDTKTCTAIERISKTEKRTYPLWPISCLHSERRLQPAEVIVKSDEFNREMSRKVGSSVPSSINPYPKDQDFKDAISKATEDTNDEIQRRVEGLLYSDDTAILTPATGLTRARPGRRETMEVPAFVVDNIKKVAANFMRDAAKLGITYFLNIDLIPALSIDGLDTATDIARACILISADLGGYYPWMHYALILAWNLSRCDKARAPDEKIEGLVMTSGHLPCVPFVIPTQNKGAFSLSPSRVNHEIEGYRCGFTNRNPDTLCLADFSGNPSYVIDARMINSALRGNSEQIKNQLDALVASSNSFINSDRGKEMKWLFKGKEEWGPQEEEKEKALEECLAKWEKWDAEEA